MDVLTYSLAMYAQVYLPPALYNYTSPISQHYMRAIEIMVTQNTENPLPENPLSELYRFRQIESMLDGMLSDDNENPRLQELSQYLYTMKHYLTELMGDTRRFTRFRSC